MQVSQLGSRCDLFHSGFAKLHYRKAPHMVVRLNNLRGRCLCECVGGARWSKAGQKALPAQHRLLAKCVTGPDDCVQEPSWKVFNSQAKRKESAGRSEDVAQLHLPKQNQLSSLQTNRLTHRPTHPQTKPSKQSKAAKLPATPKNKNMLPAIESKQDSW